MDPQYFSIMFANGVYVRQNNSYNYDLQYVNLPHDYCGQNYPYVDQNTYKRTMLREYVWLTTDDYYLASSFYGEYHVSLEFAVK